MTKSELFKAAHAVAKNLSGDYKACFVMALRIVRNQKQHIQFVKNIILNDTNKMSRIWVDGNEREGYTICYTVAKFMTGFGSQVAATVDKYGKASEKQAYVIARAFVEAGAEAGIMASYSAASLKAA